MRTLRYLTAFLSLSFSAFALSPNVTVSDTITLPNGSNPSGTLTISWARALNDNQPARQVIFPGSETVRVSNGVIDVSLFPNGSMLPGGECYSVVYNLAGYTGLRWWAIPTTTNSVNLQQIESSIACPAPYTAIIAPGQLTPGPSTGTTVLTSNPSGFVSWQPSTASGSFLFSQILSGTNNTSQTMTVGSTSVLNYSGSGVIDANQLLNTTISSLLGNSGNLTQGTGPYASGDIASFNSGSNIADSGIAASALVTTAGSYANPAWITSLAGSKLTGAIGCGSLPAFTGDASNSGCAVSVTATNGVAFAASATTNALNASNISSGTLAAARLPAINLAVSGAGGVTGNLQSSSINGGAGCSTTTWIRGDMSCQSISNGGTVTNSFGPLTAGQIVIGNGGNDETVLGSLGTTTTLLHGNAGGTPTWGAVNLATDVSGTLGGSNGGTANAYFAVSGPVSSLKTFTFPNASATVLTTSAAVTLAQGGTGGNFSSIALGGLLTGTGAGTVGITTAGTNGYVLSANSSQPGGVQWIPATGTGTVTSIVFNSPLTGGTVTATGNVGCATCVTSASSLTSNQLLIGQGSQGSAALGSLGTTTTVLHGNAAGIPAFSSVVNGDIANSAIDLTTKVTNVLPAANGGFPEVNVNAGGYNFSAAPGGTLTASTPATVTLTPCPAGVNGTDIQSNGKFHYLYVSGGTGGAEAVLITGGSCLSGNSSGTITFTPGNSHSGAWTLGSASAGIAEALNLTAVSVFLPCGVYNVYGTIQYPRTVRWRGAGESCTVVTWYGAPSAPLIVAANNISWLTPEPGYIAQMNFTSNSAGTGIGMLVGGDPAGTITPATWDGDHLTVEDVIFNSFSTSVLYGNNTFDCVWKNVNFGPNGGGNYGIQFGTIANGYEISPIFGVQPVTAEKFVAASFITAAVSAIRDNAPVNATFVSSSCVWSEHCIYVGNAAGSNITWDGGQMLGETDNTMSGACALVGCGPLVDFAVSGNLNLTLLGGTYGYSDDSVAATNLFNFSMGARVGLDAEGISLIAGSAPLTLTNAFNISVSDPAHSSVKIKLQHATQSLEPTLTNVVHTSTLTNWRIEGPNGEECFNCSNPSTVASTIYAELPACSATMQGITAAISDSTTNTWGANISGSGSDAVKAYCDGSNWTVAAK